jgi:hypothetical protein
MKYQQENVYYIVFVMTLHLPKYSKTKILIKIFIFR